MEKSEILQKIKREWEFYRDEHGYYPSATDIDTDKNMVSTKYMQRKLGGVVSVRKQLGIENPNFTKGKIRSEIARDRLNEAWKQEAALYEFLVETLGEAFVRTQEYYDYPTSRKSSDFGITVKGESYYIDIFSPKNKASFNGCLNIKSKKIPDGVGNVIFVCNNPEFTELDIKKILKRKKGLVKGTVMSYGGFKSWILGKF